MIKLIDLTKRYGKLTAVNGINLEIEQGQVFGFLGPNGAGKTTTIKMIAGLLQPTSGSAIIALPAPIDSAMTATRERGTPASLALVVEAGDGIEVTTAAGFDPDRAAVRP